MIANIDGDAELRVRTQVSILTLARNQNPGPMSDWSSDGDAIFARLGKSIAPSRIWIRNGDDSYESREQSTLQLDEGTLCQIGVHLAPGDVQTNGRFCQVVSGRLRGTRFLFNAEDFEMASRSQAPGSRHSFGGTKAG